MIEFDTQIKTIDVHELKKRMDMQQDLCLIDVREIQEWQSLHIPGAIHIPKDIIESKIESIVTDKTHPIYVHCKGGLRSQYAAEKLLELGYTEVYNIAGGIMDWVKCGYTVAE